MRLPTYGPGQEATGGTAQKPVFQEPDFIPEKLFNQMVYSLYHLLEQAGLAGEDFDVNDLGTYDRVFQSIQAFVSDRHSNLVVFDTPGIYTWNIPDDVTKAHVIVTGGGGGGTGGSAEYCTGGGAGGTSIGVFDLSNTSNIQITVGAGGSGSLNTFGSAGTSSSFGALMTAYAGTGGKRYSAYSTGAPAGVGGYVNIPGGSGTGGFISIENVASPTAYGATGGASYWRGGETGASNAAGSGTHGAGGAGNNTGSGRAGGNGLVIIQW